MAKYLRDTDLADRYAVCRSTIWRWARNGHLPAPIQLGESCTRWRLEDIEAHDAELQAA